jgi:hypothetical protein
MRLLRINENFEVIPERETLAIIPEFAELFTLNYNKQEGDVQGRKRERAKAELIYIYFMYDFRSEYANLDEEERHEQSMHAAGFPVDYDISKQLTAAIEKFRELQDTEELKLLRSAYGVATKLRTYFDTVEVDDTNAKSLIDNMSKIGNVLESLKKVEESVKKALSGNKRIRGDQVKGRQ